MAYSLAGQAVPVTFFVVIVMFANEVCGSAGAVANTVTVPTKPVHRANPFWSISTPAGCVPSVKEESRPHHAQSLNVGRCSAERACGGKLHLAGRALCHGRSRIDGDRQQFPTIASAARGE